VLPVKFNSLSAFFLVTALVSSSFGFGDQSANSPQSLSGKAVLVSLSRPSFSPLAKAANVSGTVRVLVTVQPDGATTAIVQDGHPLLKQAAVESANQSRFECRKCDGPVQYSLVYLFKRTENGNCCDGVGAPSEVTQEPESTDQEGRRQTEIIISTEHFCLCDPSAEVTQSKVRSLKCLYLWRCSSRNASATD
jgi:Gram-negative bacterial TonB protein C-terminal